MLWQISGVNTMSEYRVEMVTAHIKVYYIEAEDYEEAKELATSGKLEPDEEEFLHEQIDSEIWEY